MQITFNIADLSRVLALVAPDNSLVAGLEKLIDERHPWKKVDIDQAVPVRFEQIKAVFEGRLTEEQISRAAGCIGYALVESLRGDELGEPVVTFPKGNCGKEFTVLVFDWDSSSSIRTTPNPRRAFELASVYVVHGSRIRTTNNAGPGTRGTRLVEGVGIEASFWVR